MSMKKAKAPMQRTNKKIAKFKQNKQSTKKIRANNVDTTMHSGANKDIIKIRKSNSRAG